MRCAFELALPPGHLLRQHFVSQPPTLPDGIVRVLECQRRQWGGQPLGERRVERADFTNEDAVGPAVRDDVVDGDEQDMAPLGQVHQGGAHQWSLRQVEGLLRFQGSLFAGGGFLLGLGKVAEVHPRQRQQDFRVEVLDGRAVLQRVEAGAQCFMSLDESLEGALEGRDVQRTVELHRGGDVVERAAGLQPVQEPEALLGEGQRQCAAAGDRQQWRESHSVPLPPSVLDARGQCGDGGSLEERAQRQLDVERLTHAREDLGGEQRMASQREEVIVTADLLHVQHLGPECGQPLLRRCGGRLVGGGRGGGLRRGKRLAVHLAAGHQREGVQGDEGARHHVLGQPLLEGRTQGGGVRCGVLVGEVRHQARVAGDVLAHQDERLIYRRVLGEGGLDFAQFDAEATQLHLEVDAAHEVERAVRQPAHLVPGAVHASARGCAEGVGQEALGGELRAAQVATSEAGTRDEEFSRHSDGHQAQPGIQHVDLHVGQGATDGGTRLGAHHEGGGFDGALGGAVEVEGTGARRGRQLLPEGFVNGLAAGQQQARGGLVLKQAGLHQQPQQGRRGLEHVHPLVLYPLAQGVHILPGGVGDDAHAVAVEQLHHLLDGGIEGQRCIQAGA